MFAINTGNLSIFLVPLCSLKFYLMYLDDLDQQPLLLGERTYISVEFLEATKLVEDGFSENFPKCEETWDLFAVFTAIQQPDRQASEQGWSSTKMLLSRSAAAPIQSKAGSAAKCSVTLHKNVLENITAVTTVEGPAPPSPMKTCLWTPPPTLHPKKHPLTPTFCFPNL